MAPPRRRGQRPRGAPRAAARAGMEPFEIMISASQERMLSVVEAERLDGVLAGCARCEVDATAIGEVTGDGPGCACSTTRAWRQRSQRRSHSLTPAHNSSMSDQATASARKRNRRFLRDSGGV
ncbi:MAG TPA: AIR synthase-related protein [Solirubrobacteraceae bacterium]